MRKCLRAHWEVAKFWAAQEQIEGYCGNMLFEGTTIYSYGTHFPIANFIKENVCLFDSSSYSNSISNHQRLARRSLSAGVKVFYVPHVLRPIDHAGNIEFFCDELKECAGRFWTTLYKAEYIFNAYFRVYKDLQEYAEFFGLKIPALAGYELRGPKAQAVLKENDKRLVELRERPQWGGVQLPKWLAYLKDDELKPIMIKRITNAQVRAEFVRRVGIERIVNTLGTVTDTLGDYQLVSLDLGYKNRDGSIRWCPFLKMLNPSMDNTWHIEGVHPLCLTVRDALQYRRYGEEYFVQKNKTWNLTNNPDDKEYSFPVWEPIALT